MEFNRASCLKHFLFLVHKNKDNLIDMKLFYEVISLNKYPNANKKKKYYDFLFG